MGAELGIKNIGYLPMEVLVKQPPELLIVNDYENNYPSLGQQMLSHPALKKATMEHTMKISGRRLSCATPDYALVVKEIATRLHKAVR